MRQNKEVNPKNISGLVLLALGLFILAGAPCARAVNRQEVDVIRGKNILAEQDLDTLAKFVSEQLDQMARTDTMKVVFDTTEGLIQINTSKVPANSPTRQAYSDAYSKAFKDHYPRTLEAIRRLEEKEQILPRQLSLAVLIASADNPLFLEELLSLLKDPNPEIRYWAAKGLTMPLLRQTLQATAEDDKNLNQVYDTLSAAVAQETSGEALLAMANAGILPVNRKTAELLQKCAANRLARYQAWPLELKENLDMELLRLLFNFVLQAVPENTELRTLLMKSAADLYTAAFQRYIKATQYQTENGDYVKLLPPETLRLLENVLIDGERNFLRLTNSQRKPRIYAILNRPPQQVASELEGIFTAILGPEGEVQQIFSIYTGGKELPQLPEPPEFLITRAKTLTHVKTVD